MPNGVDTGCLGTSTLATGLATVLEGGAGEGAVAPDEGGAGLR
jgi:hypothetical protein